MPPERGELGWFCHVKWNGGWAEGGCAMYAMTRDGMGAREERCLDVMDGDGERKSETGDRR